MFCIILLTHKLMAVLDNDCSIKVVAISISLLAIPQAAFYLIPSGVLCKLAEVDHLYCELIEVI